MSQPPARLIVRYGPSLEEDYALEHDTTNLGREPFNDIVLNVPELSRRHARIIYQDDAYYIEDLNSTNGTKVNGTRIIEPTRLDEGDEIDLSDAVGFTFVMSAVAPTVSVAAAESEPVDAEPEEPPDEPAVPLPDFPTPEPPPPAPPMDFAPPAAPTPGTAFQYPPVESVPLVAESEAPPRRRGCWSYVVGCLFLLLFVVIACGGTLIVLDLYRPDYLYCGVMEPVVQLVADTLTLLGFGPYQPLACPIT